MATLQAPDIDSLVEITLARLTRPVDPFAVAATLESLGMRDADALEKYGKPDVFELAQAVYERCRKRITSAQPAHEQSLADDAPRPITLYLRRLFYHAPWAIQATFLLTRGYALGVWSGFIPSEATIVAIALMSSLIVTGGFMQVIGRAMALYPPDKHPRAARRAYLRALGLGTGAIWTGGAALLLLNPLIGQFEGEELWVMLIYYVMFAAMWLALSGLYALRRPLDLVVATTGGLIVVTLAMELTPFGAFVAHWLGMAGVCGIALARILPALRAPAQADLLPTAPASMLPYFVYGVLYFAFLFTDRIVGWSIDAARFVIDFRLSYELGLTLALVPYLLTTPILEYIAGRSIWRASQIQQRFSAYQIARHNHTFVRRYLDDLLRLMVGFGLAFALIGGLLRLAGHERLLAPFADHGVVEGVYYGAAFGYGLLVWALMNCLFLFGMSRPWTVARALATGIAISAAVGLVCSRAWGYPYSVIGLAVGGLVFAAITARAAMSGLRKMDYYGYAAY